MNNPINITCNGEVHSIESGTTVTGLLKYLNMPSRGVAVELNCRVVPRDCHDGQVLASGDQLEIVTLVGGG